MEPESSLPHSQETATCPYPEPARSTPYSHNLLPEYPPYYYPPIYTLVSQAVSYPPVSPPKPCTHLSPQYILCLTYWITSLLTYSMQHSPSWDANSFSAIQENPAFYGIRRFITAFTRDGHLSLSWTRSIQSIPSHPNSWRSILVLSFRLKLGLQSWLFPSGFPTKILYAHLVSPPCLMPRLYHFSWCDQSNTVWWGL